MGDILMENILIVYILCALIAFVINYAFAVKFAHIAEAKGYGGEYGVLCFFFGLIGYCVVIALPDRVLRRQIAMLNGECAVNRMDEEEVEKILAEGGWVCKCGRVNAKYVSTCTCGKNKRDAVKC